MNRLFSKKTLIIAMIALYGIFCMGAVCYVASRFSGDKTRLYVAPVLLGLVPVLRLLWGTETFSRATIVRYVAGYTMGMLVAIGALMYLRLLS